MVGKISGLIVLMTIGMVAMAQEAPPTANALKVWGEIDTVKWFAADNLERFKRRDLGPVVVTLPGSGKADTLANVQGILLKDVLRGLEFTLGEYQVSGDFYFVCRGSDGFVNVFSWFELFNNSIGNNVYLVVNGGGSAGEEDILSLISPSGLSAGNRYIPVLKEVEVKRASFEY